MKIRFFIKYILRLFLLERSHALITILSIAAGTAILAATAILGRGIHDSAIENARVLHGGDIVAIGLSEPFTTKYLEKAKELKRNRTIAGYNSQAFFNEIVGTNKRSALGGFWFIENNHPLYGPRLKSISPRDVNIVELLNKGVVVSQKLANKLNLKIGDKIRLGIEPGYYKVSGIISDSAQPSMDARLTGFIVRPMKQFSFAQSYSNSQDKGSSKIVAIKTNKPSDAFKIKKTMQKVAPRYTFLQTADDVEKQIKDAMVVFNKGITAYGFISLLVVGIGIGYSTRLWARRRLRDTAVFKALGLKTNDIKILFVLTLGLFFMIGGVLGSLLSLGFVILLKDVIRQFFSVSSHFAWFYPKEIALSLVATFLVVIAFSVSSIAALSRTLPAISLRIEEGIFPVFNKLFRFANIIIFASLLICAAFIVTKDLPISSLVVLVTLVLGALFILILWLVIHFLPLSLPFGNNFRLAVKSLKNQGWLPARTSLVVLVGILTLSLVLVISEIIKTNLALEVRKQTGHDAIVTTPPGSSSASVGLIKKAPNLKNVTSTEMRTIDIIAINSSKERLSSLKEKINSGQKGYDPYIFRIAQNITLVDLQSYEPWQVLGKGRQLNIDDKNKRVMVISERIAQGLRVRLGDSLQVKSADEVLAFKIVGITINNSIISGPDGIIAPLGTVPGSGKTAHTYYINFKKDKEKGIEWLYDNLKGVPILDISNLTDSFTTVIDNLRTFPFLMSLLSLFASVVIIWSSISFSVMQRKRELAILRSLGAKSRKIIWLLVNEHLIIGLVGGDLALVATIVVSKIVSQTAFKTQPVFNYLSLTIVFITAIALSILAGLVPAIRVARAKPLEVLRNE